MAERQQRQRLRALRDNRQLSRFVVEGRATGKQLGTGSYGSVEEVEVNGLICAGKKIHDVLIDAANAGVENVASKYVQECQLMSDLRHPNITLFLGVCFAPDCELPVLLMERLDSSLDDLLETVPNIPLALKRSILEDVSRGLLYLHKHTPQIIHRDLTAKNVLLTSYFVAKITDLGNSRIVNLQPGQLARTLSQLPGTLVYMPPEALSASSRYGPSLDVFSFGHLALFTLIQVFPGDLLEPNYADPNDPERLMARTEVERRQCYFDQLKEETLIPLIKLCLHNSPLKRPSAERLVTALEGMKGVIEGDYGELATVDAVRQVRTLKALNSRSQDKINELAAKDEQIQQLVAADEQHEIVLHQKDEQLRQKNAELEQIQEEVTRVRTELQQKSIIVQQKDVQLEQHNNRNQQLTTLLREKDDRLRQREEELQQKETQLQRNSEELQRKNADISKLQREIQALQESLLRATQHSSTEQRPTIRGPHDDIKDCVARGGGVNTQSIPVREEPLRIREVKNEMPWVDQYMERDNMLVVQGQRKKIQGQIRRATSQEFAQISSNFARDWDMKKGACPNVDYVFVITNSTLLNKWNLYKQRLRDQTVEPYYHGTSVTCNIVSTGRLCPYQSCGICGISSDGLKRDFIRKNIPFQRFGHGFYLVPNSSKCHDYTKGAYNYRAMLLCDVCPGRKYVLQSNSQQMQGPPHGFDSIYGVGGQLNYPEIVIHNPDAVMPRYIIMYKKDGVRHPLAN